MKSNFIKKGIQCIFALSAICLLLSLLPATKVQAAERSLSLDKDVYEVGEAIMVTATGESTDYLCLYLEEYVPGQDAGIYYACFDNSLEDTVDFTLIKNNEPTNVFDWFCATPSNPQVSPYIDIPEGDYKIVLRDESGELLDEQAFEVVYQSSGPTEDPNATENPDVTENPTTEKPTPSQTEALIITAEPDDETDTVIKSDDNTYVWIIVGVVAAVIIAAVVFVIVKKKK